MVRSATLLIALTILVASAGVGADAGGRGLLWRVVQACMANHYLTGGAFPCLQVATDGGTASGYVVLRAPLEDTHVILTPTVRTVGIEEGRLRGAGAPDYFQDAWSIRHFVTDGLTRQPARDDLAMAVNSRPGRSQDQLHIHVDCIRPTVKQSLQRQMSSLRTQGWTQISVAPHAPRYWALAVARGDLTGVNVFDLVATGLKIDANRMDDTTIVVAGSDAVREGPGFVILARQRAPHSIDEAHGEALLNHSCAAFR